MQSKREKSSELNQEVLMQEVRIYRNLNIWRKLI